jgi:hypothetical protein
MTHFRLVDVDTVSLPQVAVPRRPYDVAMTEEQQPQRSALVAWLRRPKIWDDVFTRTVANLLSAAVVLIVVASSGLVHVRRHTWIILGAYVGLFGYLATELITGRSSLNPRLRRPLARLLRMRLPRGTAGAILSTAFFFLAIGCGVLAIAL